MGHCLLWAVAFSRVSHNHMNSNMNYHNVPLKPMRASHWTSPAQRPGKVSWCVGTRQGEKAEGSTGLEWRDRDSRGMVEGAS